MRLDQTRIGIMLDMGGQYKAGRKEREPFGELVQMHLCVPRLSRKALCTHQLEVHSQRGKATLCRSLHVGKLQECQLLHRSFLNS